MYYKDKEATRIKLMGKSSNNIEAADYKLRQHDISF